jgi:hypothetical protein
MFFHRRDFRLIKLDPTTKQTVPNPITWVEMSGIEIVWRKLEIYIFILSISLVTHWWIHHLQLCYTYATRWTLGWNIYASNFSWTRKYNIDVNNRNSYHTKYISNRSLFGRRMLWHIGLADNQITIKIRN